MYYITIYGLYKVQNGSKYFENLCPIQFKLKQKAFKTRQIKIFFILFILWKYIGHIIVKIYPNKYPINISVGQWTPRYTLLNPIRPTTIKLIIHKIFPTLLLSLFF